MKPNTRRFRHMGRVLALICVSFLAGCSRGQVTEKGSNRPLEGVVVVAAKYGTVGIVVQGSTRCFHLAHTHSDEGGTFSLPVGYGVHLAYKPGYHLANDGNLQEQILMERHADSPAERFEQILKPAMQIPYGCPEDEVRNLVDPILRPIHAELMPLVKTQSQLEKADGVLDAIEILTIGEQAAYANSERRRIERLKSPLPR